MALGDGIRRNIADVEPAERALLRDALIELNRRVFPGGRNDTVPGGVTFWFKQDEIHQATHVHRGPEFVPWHREIVNRFEAMLRDVDPRLSLHYWDWTQDPRAIPSANLGGGQRGTLNLFTPDFMGYGGPQQQPIGAPWLNARYYVPGANPHRDVSNNPADPPQLVLRSIAGSPATIEGEVDILDARDWVVMRGLLETVHDDMHGFVSMGGPHISFRDPFVFLLHSNVDRLLARWQTDPAHPERLDAQRVYGPERDLDVQVGQGVQNLSHNVEPWSTGQSVGSLGGQPTLTRPWCAPENQGAPKNYLHPSIVIPRNYDTNGRGRSWIGRFSRADRTELLYHYPGRNEWWLGTHDGQQIRWRFVGDTSGFGHAITEDGRPFWVGDFNGDGRTEVLFYYPGDDHWWMGSFADAAASLSWTLVSNTAGFGHAINDGRPFWVGNFSRTDRAEILFYYAGDRRWWLGTLEGNALQWSFAGDTSGFGQVWDGRPFWIGDFSGNGRADVLFYFPGDDRWWLASHQGPGGQFAWSSAGQTSGFGHAINDGRPFWAGNFSRADRTEMLFYYPGDQRWWLGTHDGQELRWTSAGSTAGFGQVGDGRPIWTGDFTGDGRTDVLFYFPGDDRWWLGTHAGPGGELAWSQVSRTTGFGHAINDGRPFWIGDFDGNGRADVLFHYPRDGNWWLGSQPPGASEFAWSGVGNRRHL